MAVGCQPETQAPTLESRAGALAGEVGTWTPTSAKTYPSTSAILLRGTGEVLDPYFGFVHRYDPYTNTWRAMNPMCSPGYCSNAVLTELPSGKVLAGVMFAGRMGGTPGMMLYDPGTDSWSHANASYSRGSVTLLDSGKVLLAGGYTYLGGNLVPLATAREYDPDSDTWTPLPGSMTTPRYGHSATLLYSGKVLVTGGASSEAPAELFDPSTGTWTATSPMPHPGGEHRALRLYSGNVMVLVTTMGASETPVDMYDPYNGRWFSGPALPFTQPTSATLLYSGEVLVVNNAGQAALYSPTQNAWLPAASATASTSRGAAVLLHTGEVLLLNGSTPVAERFSR
ncbi:hypothetical protein JRI60_01065 [Archangium violaceum]|nr:hypothetical protein JRI60_01065 [Archangium violaceum]